MHHGRADLLQVFNDVQASHVKVQSQAFPATPMMQTINNPDGTVSIIQIDPGPNSIVTLPDGSQATVVHAVSYCAFVCKLLTYFLVLIQNELRVICDW